MIKVLIFIIIIGSVVFFLWHAELNAWVDNFTQKTQDQAAPLIKQGADASIKILDSASEKWIDDFVKKLTTDGKTKIDQWLQGKNLNDFGDAIGTMYTGATPLFNEVTGQSIDRYNYLLQKFPNLIKDLNLQQYLK